MSKQVWTIIAAMAVTIMWPYSFGSAAETFKVGVVDQQAILEAGPPKPGSAPWMDSRSFRPPDSASSRQTMKN